MSEPDPSDIALYLIGEILDDLPDDAHLYQMDLHKILYLLQKRLDDDNLVAEKLPFYWYRHGPVTQAVFEASESATRRDVAQTEQNEQGTRYLQGPATPPSPSIDTHQAALSEASDELSEIIENYRFYQQRDRLLEEDIYSDAPYAFQPEVKFNLLPATQTFVDNERPEPERLADSFNRAESKLPLDDSFSGFNSEFSRLVTLAEMFLDDDAVAHPLLQAELQELVETAWRVFSDHLQSETADDYYADSQQQWERNAQQSLSVFAQELNAFEQRLKEAGFFERDAPRATEGESWARVAESILSEN